MQRLIKELESVDAHRALLADVEHALAHRDGVRRAEQWWTPVCEADDGEAWAPTLVALDGYESSAGADLRSALLRARVQIELGSLDEAEAQLDRWKDRVGQRSQHFVVDLRAMLHERRREWRSADLLRK